MYFDKYEYVNTSEKKRESFFQLQTTKISRNYTETK